MTPNLAVTETLPGDRDELQDESDDSKYQVSWSNIMDKGKWGKPLRYKHVCALLLYWDKSCGDLSTEKEVDELKAVLEDVFQYHAEKAPLMAASRGKKVQTMINQIVANFIDRFDGPENLLIIYYAGHGMPDKGKYGRLQLLGSATFPIPYAPNADYSSATSTNDNDRGVGFQDKLVIWNDTEMLLKSAAAHVFEIFDW